MKPTDDHHLSYLPRRHYCRTPAHLGLTMLRMRLPVLRVLHGQCGIPNDQQVLGVLLLGRLREVEASREDGFAVDDHHLGVRNRMLDVDHRRHP
jgi:hypothetical protein